MKMSILTKKDLLTKERNLDDDEEHLKRPGKERRGRMQCGRMFYIELEKLTFEELMNVKKKDIRREL